SGPTGTPTKPKVLALGMYTKSSKYIPLQKGADWVQPTLLPKKKQVTFLEPHRTSPRSTQKPPVQHKKPTVSVNMFRKAKPATKARKPIPKRNTQNHNLLPAKSVKARRAADYYRNLYVDISQFVDRSMKYVHTKSHQAKRVVNTSTNDWNATKNTVARIVPIWKPTGRRFNLHDIFGSRKSTEPIVKPSKLTPCVSPSTNATLSLEPILEPPNATASNAIFEINKLKAQLREKDDTIRHLHAKKDIIGLLNVGSTESSFEMKALETEIAQLKKGLTSLKIQNDGYK
nr:hypothetical protein [Tanacetum cinerariifolium]